MEKTINSEVSSTVFQAVPLLIDFPTQRFWVDYDREADVLYISFQRPQKATDTEMTEEGIPIEEARAYEYWMTETGHKYIVWKIMTE